MRRIAYTLCCVQLAIGGLGSDSPKEYDDAVETVGIEGTWRLTKVEINGKKVEMPLQISDTYCGRLFTFNYSDGEKIEGSYRIDLTRKPPQLELVPSNGLRKGQTLGRIYQIDGDTLRVAARIGDGRQQGFNKEGLEVSTYKRVR